MTTTVLVDGRNVLRSEWPNIPEDDLVRLVGRWAEELGVHPVVVFDGRAPDVAVEGVEVVGTGSESADDWLIRETARLREEGTSHWLVTSDRALREVAGTGAERLIGGGSLARDLRRLSG